MTDRIPAPQFAKETLNALLLWRWDHADGNPAYYKEVDDRFLPVTWPEAKRETLELCGGLWARGLERGDKAAILANVHHEWVQCDFANLAMGLVTVGIYPTTTTEQIEYILNHSESRFLVVENQELLDHVAPAVAAYKELQFIATIDKGLRAPDGLTLPLFSLSDLRTEGATWLAQHGDEQVFERAMAAEPDDLATLVYTSGTTGPPKGAMLSHRNLFHVSEAVPRILDFLPDDRSVVYLPLAHVLQRYTIYLGLRVNVQAYFTSRLTRLADVLGEVQPTLLAAVPRVLEKIHARAMAKASELRPRQRKVFHWAVAVGGDYAAAQRTGRPVSLSLRLRHAIADRLVLSRIRERLGGAIRLIISGGAPLSPDLSEWFHACGLLVIEGYGLTETSAPATTCTPDAYRFGSVGRAIPDTEVRIADDGEILIRGPGVFGGYFKNEEASKEAFDEDGFFRSGDIGELDSDGFLRITDRKKDILITAGGKNVGPANIENLLKEHPLIGQALVYGDRKPYLVAAITLDPEEALPWAQNQGKEGATLETLAKDPEVLAQVGAHVEASNQRLARFENLKKWTLLPVPFLPENGYLTPTLKLKRRAIIRDFAHEFEALYNG